MKNLTNYVVVAACLTLVACVSISSNPPGQFAQPPEFDFADGAELRTGMHQLAFALQRLDHRLASQEDDSAPSSAFVIDSLTEIERIAKGLRAGDLSTKHPYLKDGMDKFLSDVERAQWYAEKDRFYMAGRLTGACISCHQSKY